MLERLEFYRKDIQKSPLINLIKGTGAYDDSNSKNIRLLTSKNTTSSLYTLIFKTGLNA